MTAVRGLTVPDTPLTSGTLSIVIIVAGAAGLCCLLAGRSRNHLIAVGCALIVAVALFLTLSPLAGALDLLAEPLPGPARAWVAVGTAAVCLAVARIILADGLGRRLTSIVATLAVIVTCANGVNREFDAYPTLGVLLNPSPVGTATPGEFAAHGITVVDLPNWYPPSTPMPASRLVAMHIPPTTSSFTARDAIVYLPPAYFTNPRPRLPVLVLLAGEPGSPDDWVRSGGLVETMDGFAAAHRGLAPVVVVADGTGSRWGNPACVDSPAGNVMTYLTADLHTWAEQNLTVSLDRTQWAVGGLSYGGTCAFQLVTNHPDDYRVFLDMSGQLEPTLGSRKHTVDTLFGGNEAAFRAINPLDILATKRFPDTSGAFVVGIDDHEYRPGLEQVHQAAKAAGMQVEFKTVPGGHSFAVWRTGLATELPWIATHLGIH
ncbi:hypothetical protein GOHSU_56_00060 [Gordonia hirsuta DSM 44140 = NBRC 16056]|uniref:Esterase n=1 Tax=Gordonia hirsuta DSM 44140 = NBRC 16056 TaxID=1121927 RepID=L7LFN1_9ACTN|nr:alpha/beta hydrolase-fold protein [Gordonia hirsuta]GAC58873.1 hypothetical protein GOHSU_56_00060 [Gordonia hirsuta DSM 44140 = NBRC 16056]